MGSRDGRTRSPVVTARSEESLSSTLGDILQASDNLSRVISSYKRVMEGQAMNGEVAISTLPDSEGT